MRAAFSGELDQRLTGADSRCGGTFLPTVQYPGPLVIQITFKCHCISIKSDSSSHWSPFSEPEDPDIFLEKGLLIFISQVGGSFVRQKSRLMKLVGKKP